MGTNNPTIGGDIDGTSIQNYARSLRRVHHICNPGQHAYLTLNTTFPITLTPGLSCTLEEGVTSGTMAKVLTGSVVKVTRSRPSHDLIVDIDDTYHKVVNTFIDTRLSSDNTQPVTYWIDRILTTLVGVDFNYVTPLSGYIEANTELGLRSAHDALTTLLAYSAAYVYADPNGVLQIGRMSSVTSGSITQFLEFERVKSDEQTRNVVKVFGKSPIFAKEVRHPTGIDPDRIAVIASPGIATTIAARELAQFAIGELAPVTDIKTFRTTGSPAWRPAMKVAIQYSGGNSRFQYNQPGIITSVESEISENGYTMEIKADERCPRIAGWSEKQLVLYAGTAGQGVFRSTDKGVTWTDMNNGLPSNRRFIGRIAANDSGQVMSITNSNELWYHNGETWSRITLPNPPSLSSPGALIAVDSSGEGVFNVLTVNGNGSNESVQQARSFVYSSSGSITSGSQGWGTPVQLVNELGGNHVVAYDLSSRYGVPYIVGTGSGSIYDNPDTSSGSCLYISATMSHEITAQSVPPFSPNECIGEGVGTAPPDAGPTGWFITNVQNIGTAPNRRVQFDIIIDFNYKRCLNADSDVVIKLRGIVHPGRLTPLPGPFPFIEIWGETTFHQSAGGSGYDHDKVQMTILVSTMDEVETGGLFCAQFSISTLGAENFCEPNILRATDTGWLGEPDCNTSYLRAGFLTYYYC